MIELARLVDTEARALRQVADDQGEVKQQAHAAISRARNALLGTTVIRTPRSHCGWRSARCKVTPRKGAKSRRSPRWLRSTNAPMKCSGPPFELPPLWDKRKSRLNLKTAFNFVSTAGHYRGNSGSPVVNRRANSLASSSMAICRACRGITPSVTNRAGRHRSIRRRFWKR